jgi:hypothetical protein
MYFALKCVLLLLLFLTFIWLLCNTFFSLDEIGQVLLTMGKLKAVKIGALILRWQYNESTFVARLNLLWAPDIHGGLHSIVHLNLNVQNKEHKCDIKKWTTFSDMTDRPSFDFLKIKYTYPPKVHPWLSLSTHYNICSAIEHGIINEPIPPESQLI